MFKVAFDVMGNDNGVQDAVKASIEFAKNNPNFKLILVGDANEIQKYYFNQLTNIDIYDSKNTIRFSTNFRKSLTENYSMTDAIKLVIDKDVDAVLSSGDSGMYLAAATLLVKRLNGVSRPAFMPIFPTTVNNQKFLMLDVGANVDCRPNYLVEWAKIASIFYKYMFNIDNPVVKQVNIGTEEYKGGELQIETHKLLKNSGLNYQGFVEPRSLLDNDCDVAVIDGFSGNLVLKSLEGAILSFKKILKEALTKNVFRKMIALSMKKSFKEIGNRLDYRNVGAAWVIGVNAMMIKSHGSSDTKAYLGALNQIKLGLEKDIFTKIKDEFK